MTGLFISQWFWLFLLLPIAALCGWVIGRRGGERHGDSQVSKLSTTYFRGLNYLLNEQPDKAIGCSCTSRNWTRKPSKPRSRSGTCSGAAGQVDRAIRLHRALVERRDLSDPQKVQALLALGEDYMKSGLLDRAETVFTDLARIDQRARRRPVPPDRHLPVRTRLEQGDVENAGRYEAATGADGQAGRASSSANSPTRARRRRRGRARGGGARLRRRRDLVARGHARRADRGRSGQRRGAIRAFERAARHDPDYLPEILPTLLASYDRRRRDRGAQLCRK